MKQRIITAIILGIVAIPICIFSGTVVFPIAMSFIAVVGVYELLGCMGTRKCLFVSLPLYAMALIVPFVVRYFRAIVFDNGIKILGILLIYVLYLLAFWIFSYEKNQAIDVNKILTSVLVSLYIIGAVASIILVRDGKGGVYNWYFIFIGAWVTDIFAYFSGRFFGKHKLMPIVSPKKTVEGSIGGSLFCVAFFLGYGLLMNHFVSAELNLLTVAVAGILSAVVSQIGDLSMSVIKRIYGIKDYGKIFPGHGGILDRFDSILAVAIVMAFFLA